MVQSQSSNRFDIKRRRRCPANLDVTVEEVADQAARERLRRAYEFILLVAEQANQDRCTEATESQGEEDDG
jgi:hypothetical protein